MWRERGVREALARKVRKWEEIIYIMKGCPAADTTPVLCLCRQKRLKRKDKELSEVMLLYVWSEKWRKGVAFMLLLF